MTVAELIEILSGVDREIEVKLLAVNTDNINENYGIADIVITEPLCGTQFKHEIVIIPE